MAGVRMRCVEHCIQLISLKRDNKAVNAAASSGDSSAVCSLTTVSASVVVVTAETVVRTD